MRSMGYALYLAQVGRKHPDAKPLKGFGGAGVLEVIEGFEGNAYRTVYTCSMHFRRNRETRSRPRKLT